ncbi:deoxyguanosinetriphosphate triphosphohydrolase [Anaerolineales bacterium]
MLYTRARLEQIELETLAPYALKSAHSQGRKYPDHEPEYRTAFQRDRDRIVHSAAFRRLEYKTQVFVNDAGDYYRTRLTHTLEVSQVGRAIAKGLGLNEDLVETICLAHDLGHPPFGHAGEYILNDLMESQGGFNHNFQSYRVVTKLETRYPNFPGLNLTHETLEGIAKHETEYDVSAEYDFDPNTRASLEAQIANIADELAYNAHDLDDGLKSELIYPDQLRELELGKLIADELNWGGGRMDEVTRHRYIRNLVGRQIDDVLMTTEQNLAALNPQTPEDVQKQDHNLVTHSEHYLRMNKEWKNFLFENMYRHYRVVRMQTRAEYYISRLFESYCNEPRQLPPDFQQRITDKNKERVVADYIACLTDRSALLEYRRLFDPMTRP